MTRLEKIVFLCRDSRHTLQTVLAVGNKLPLEISESLLPRSFAPALTLSHGDRVVARNNFIVFLSRYVEGRAPEADAPEGNRAQKISRAATKPPDRIRVRRDISFPSNDDGNERADERRKGGANTIVAAAADDAC